MLDTGSVPAEICELHEQREDFKIDVFERAFLVDRLLHAITHHRRQRLGDSTDNVFMYVECLCIGSDEECEDLAGEVEPGRHCIVEVGCN